MFKVTMIKGEERRGFLRSLHRDRILHFFTIYDLERLTDKTKVWAVYEGETVKSYLLEFDSRIVHIRGEDNNIECLLELIDLDDVILIIEPHHLMKVKRFFRPIEPIDPSSRGSITKFRIMKLDKTSFKPVINHYVKRLKMDDLDEILRSLGDERRELFERALQRGLVYGAYEGKKLASIAMAPEIIGDLALVRGVYTDPKFRGRGLATSAVSALINELVKADMEVILWVAEDNIPARRVYWKVGFNDTGHILLGFKGRRTSPT